MSRRHRKGPHGGGLRCEIKFACGEVENKNYKKIPLLRLKKKETKRKKHKIVMTLL